MSTSDGAVGRPVDPLTDPLRVAAARRLLLEVPGPAAFDRLSALTARVLGVGHAKVTLFTDHDVVVGGHGLPAGVVGGPSRRRRRCRGRSGIRAGARAPRRPSRRRSLP